MPLKKVLPIQATKRELFSVNESMLAKICTLGSCHTLKTKWVKHFQKCKTVLSDDWTQMENGEFKENSFYRSTYRAQIHPTRHREMEALIGWLDKTEMLPGPGTFKPWSIHYQPISPSNSCHRQRSGFAFVHTPGRREMPSHTTN